MNCETDNPAGVLVHYDHYLVVLQQNQFASEEVKAPQAILIDALLVLLQRLGLFLGVPGLRCVLLLLRGTAAGS